MGQVLIKRSERVCFFGRTGSGKTTLARSLLHSCNLPFVVLDPKHGYTDGKVKVTHEYNKRYKEQILRVPPLGGDDELELWDRAIYDIWKHGDTIIYVDEATLITPPRAILPELGRAIRTGRQRNVPVWTGSQRPKDIPSIVFTEAEHFFLFRLQWEDDRRKVSSFTSELTVPYYSDLMRGGKPRKHDFLYYGVDDDRLIVCHATQPTNNTAVS